MHACSAHDFGAASRCAWFADVGLVACASPCMQTRVPVVADSPSVTDDSTATVRCTTRQPPRQVVVTAPSVILLLHATHRHPFSTHLSVSAVDDVIDVIR
jgi:hypothetical protein